MAKTEITLGPIVTSPSGRTTVAVDMNDDGSFLIVADRDGHRIHHFSANYEQPGPDGKPKAG